MPGLRIRWISPDSEEPKWGLTFNVVTLLVILAPTLYTIECTLEPETKVPISCMLLKPKLRFEVPPQTIASD